MSLEKQCAKLSLPLKEIKLDYSGKPEPALLSYFEAQGYTGSFIEGYTLLTVLKALMLDMLSELNSFDDRSDACARYLEAQFVILEDDLDCIINSIKDISKEKYLDNLKEIINNPFVKSHHPDLSYDCCEALFDAIEKDTFLSVARKFSEDPYKYRNGWPDLIIVKDQEVKFIEVKTSDKLTKSQLLTIPIFKEILPYEFIVFRVLK